MTTVVEFDGGCRFDLPTANNAVEGDVVGDSFRERTHPRHSLKERHYVSKSERAHRPEKQLETYLLSCETVLEGDDDANHRLVLDTRLEM